MENFWKFWKIFLICYFSKIILAFSKQVKDTPLLMSEKTKCPSYWHSAQCVAFSGPWTNYGIRKFFSHWYLIQEMEQVIKSVFNKFGGSLWKIKFPLSGNSSSKKNTMSKQLTSSWREFRESSSFPDNKSCLNYLIKNEVFSQFTESKNSDKLANFQEEATALGIRGPQK